MRKASEASSFGGSVASTVEAKRAVEARLRSTVERWRPFIIQSRRMVPAPHNLIFDRFARIRVQSLSRAGQPTSAVMLELQARGDLGEWVCCSRFRPPALDRQSHAITTLHRRDHSLVYLGELGHFLAFKSTLRTSDIADVHRIDDVRVG